MQRPHVGTPFNGLHSRLVAATQLIESSADQADRTTLGAISVSLIWSLPLALSGHFFYKS